MWEYKKFDFAYFCEKVDVRVLGCFAKKRHKAPPIGITKLTQKLLTKPKTVEREFNKIVF